MKADELRHQELAELIKNLPIKLRKGVREDVLVCAINEKVIELTEDGKLRWLLESKTLHAYFCGRMWCGDEATYNRRRRTYAWKRGRRAFPTRDIQRLFGESGLRNLRYKRELRTPPEGFELIDSLFDTKKSAP